MPEMLAKRQVWSNGKRTRTIQQVTELKAGLVFFVAGNTDGCVAESTFQQWIKRTGAKCVATGALNGRQDSK